MRQSTLDTHKKSAVAFKGQSRFHLAIKVRDLDVSIDFYSKLFAAGPTKIRAAYAKWDLDEPSINFTLNQHKQMADGPTSLSHLGIQVKTFQQLQDHMTRMIAANLVLSEEQGTACCFARQDKFWVQDPDGHKIEFFLVTQADVVENDGQHQACCVDEA